MNPAKCRAALLAGPTGSAGFFLFKSKSKSESKLEFELELEFEAGWNAIAGQAGAGIILARRLEPNPSAGIAGQVAASRARSARVGRKIKAGKVALEAARPRLRSELGQPWPRLAESR